MTEVRKAFDNNGIYMAMFKNNVRCSGIYSASWEVAYDYYCCTGEAIDELLRRVILDDNM